MVFGADEVPVQVVSCDRSDSLTCLRSPSLLVNADDLIIKGLFDYFSTVLDNAVGAEQMWDVSLQPILRLLDFLAKVLIRLETLRRPE